MKYKCACCGSVDSRHDWANSQLGEYYCPQCLTNGRETPRARPDQKPASLRWLALGFFLAAVLGLAVLIYFVRP